MLSWRLLLKAELAHAYSRAGKHIMRASSWSKLSHGADTHLMPCWTGFLTITSMSAAEEVSTC